jgi:hypothetical protein
MSWNTFLLVGAATALGIDALFALALIACALYPPHLIATAQEPHDIFARVSDFIGDIRFGPLIPIAELPAETAEAVRLLLPPVPALSGNPTCNS